MLTTVEVLNTLVSEIMTKHVVTVQSDDLMQTVRDLFAENKIHHLPVVDEKDQVIGMITRHDFNMLLNSFTCFETPLSEAKNDQIMRTILVGEVMTEQVCTLNKNEPVTKAADIFKENLFHAVPVVDDDEKLVGIVSTFDLIVFAFPKS